MGRDDGLDTIVLEVYQSLVQEIQRLPVVLSNGCLEVRASRLAKAALDTGATSGLVAHPETDDLDTV